MKNDIRLMFMILLGAFVFFLVPISGIADYPEIWSATYVHWADIVSKACGIAIMGVSGYFLIFFQPKDKSNKHE